MNKSDPALELATLLYEHGFIVDSKNTKHHEADLQDVAALLRPHVWEWIPVEELIPALHVPVLLWNDEQVAEVGIRAEMPISTDLPPELRGWFFIVGKGDNAEPIHAHRVTHWAALPSAPLSNESKGEK